MKREDVSAVRNSILVPADAGTVLQAFGDTVQVKLSGDKPTDPWLWP